MRIRRRTVSLQLAAMAMVAACRLESRGTPVQSEKLAPGFDLTDHRGNAVSSAALLGRGPLIVVFYRGDW